MAITFEQASKALVEFVQEYVTKKDYAQYINSAGVTQIWQMEEKPAKGIMKDHCLAVYLIQQPPLELRLPPEYKGIKVYYKEARQELIPR